MVEPIARTSYWDGTGRCFAERLPHASSHQIEGVGHYLPLEAPEALTAITADVLATAT